jgi:histone arginine demethylase JMJD6
MNSQTSARKSPTPATVLEVERRANLEYPEFAKKYLHANRPVIVTDALHQWQALSRWTPEFFKRDFGSLKFNLDDGNRYKHEHEGNRVVEYTMAAFIDRVLASTEKDPAPYFRNKILYDTFPTLGQDIQPLPEYVLPNWLPDRYLVKYVSAVLNRAAAIEIYIGGKGGAFPVLHYDGAGAHAFLMQVHGRKEFILFRPDQEQFLYPSPERENLSLIKNVENPDLGMFPLFANATPMKFVLDQGEMVFIPSHWWHTTKMLTTSISISVNVVNQSNWRELVSFVSRRRRNPLLSLASRVYLTSGAGWRSWRDRNWRKRVRVSKA